MPEINVDFTYYHPINDKQVEFHKSKAKHKLLLGGFGAGKTYPAIHEVYFHCFQNPKHEFLVAKNTWDTLRSSIKDEFIQIGREANAIKSESKKDNYIILQNDCKVIFRPLTLKESQYKGFNLCGMLIDDPNVDRFSSVIGFLFSRLRDKKVKAKKFMSIITSNYEGHNWLWQKYIRDREQGGNDLFAYWILPTNENPTLPPDFIETLAMTHSKKWMDRYVKCDMSSYTGLIYDEFNRDVHCKDLSYIKEDKGLIKILAIDLGITDPTVVLKMATDMHNIYIYDEWYRWNVRTDILGEYLKVINANRYKAMVIDRSSKKRDQTSGDSAWGYLTSEYRMRLKASEGNVLWRIELVKTLLSVKDGKTRIYIDPVKCPHTVAEFEVYKWAVPSMSEFEDLTYKEQPLDKDNHCMDAMGYGVVYFMKYLKGTFNTEGWNDRRSEQIWAEREKKLKLYKEHNYSRINSDRLDYKTRKLVSLHKKARSNVKFDYHFG